MTIAQFRATIRQRPFRDFTIQMVDGRVFPVAHPDCVAVSPTGRTVIVFQTDDSSSVVDLLLMSEREVPPTQSKAG
jgi:hypothetical protein